MSDELEELARKGRAAESDFDDRAVARGKAQEAYRRYLTDRLVAHTFRHVHGNKALPLLAVAVTIGALVVAVTIFDADMYSIVGLVLAGLGGTYLMYRYVERRAMGLGGAWLEGLPFEFDHEAYLGGLAESRMNTRVRLDVVFSESQETADRDTFADACAGAVTLEKREWSGHKLTLESAQISSYFPAREDRESYYSNALVHEWFVTLVDKALRPIHGRQTIGRIRVRFEK